MDAKSLAEWESRSLDSIPRSALGRMPAEHIVISNCLRASDGFILARSHLSYPQHPDIG